MTAKFSDINSPKRETKYRRGLRKRLNDLLRHKKLKPDAVIAFIAAHEELGNDKNARTFVEAFAKGFIAKPGLRELMAMRQRVNRITLLLQPGNATAPAPDIFV